MTIEEATQSDGARVRLLVIGALSSSPNGRKFSLTPASFMDQMRASAIAPAVSITDRIQGRGRRTIQTRLENLRAFQLQGVIASTPELARLAAINDELSSSTATRLDSDEILAKVKAAAGEGSLFDAVASALGKTAAKAPSPAAEGGGSIDAIFAGAELPTKSSAASAVEAFAGATRSSTTRTTSSAIQKARTALEDALFASASDVLRHPEIGNLESSWRGLKLLVEAAGGEVAIDAIDHAADAALAALDALRSTPSFERPDAILLLDVVSKFEDLSPWAAFGEELMLPVLATVARDSFGKILDAVVAGEAAAPLPAWDELRQAESSRWLSVATNRFVLAVEGAGSARRVVFGNPALVVAGALISSFRRSGTFGQALGPNHPLRAPETWTLPSGRESGSSSPVEAFYPVAAQQKLAAFGLVALGAAKNSDRIILTHAPTVRRSHDAVPLPAQLLTGRVVRFVEWCRDQIADGTPSAEIPAIFQDASEVLLFPAANGAAVLAAQVVEGGPRRELVVRVAVNSAYAGSPFELELGLGAI